MALYFWCSQKIFRTKIFKFPHSFKGQATLPDSIYHKLLDCNLCRDKETLEQYDRLKLPNLYLQPDLALYYYGKPSKFRFETQSSRQNIAIALRYDRLANEPEIAHCVAKLLLDKDVQTIKYVSQVTLDYDINASEAKRNNVPIVNYNITNASLKAITETYAISKYVISNRLHALLLGMINGAIPIAIIDAKEDRKILSYLEILGVPWVEKENLCESDALANMLKNFSFPQYKSEHIQKCIRQLLVNHA
jgi:exopolysaccharide biosynthesis predicted pyruvyltransferase EpsI